MNPVSRSAWWVSWIGPIGVTVLAAVLRLVNLGRPHEVVFDETYYVKDGLSLTLFGYERNAVDGANAMLLDTSLSESGSTGAGLTALFTDQASFVVHPPAGKWIIGLSQMLFGANPWGWRMLVALLGVATVLLVTLIVWRMTRSPWVGSLAGLFLAIDGVAIVMSRTALLDGILAFFVVAAVGCLVLDRDWTRRRVQVYSWMWWRPWRYAAGVALGLACATKWSGAYFVVAVAGLAFVWDLTARRRAGSAHPWRVSIARDLPTIVVGIGLVAVAVYVLSWSGWIFTDGGYDRQWAAQNPASGVLGLVPDWLRSLAHYHAQALSFHTGLTSEHSYQSNPWSWPVLARPVVFSYDGAAAGCAGGSCVTEVVALGNPLLWWGAVAALLHQAWRWATRWDWRSATIVVGFLAGWLPWLLFQERTVFNFYAIVLAPFMMMAIALSIAMVLRDARVSRARFVATAAVLGALVVACVIVSAFFMPIWVGEPITTEQWQLRMWFPSWV